MKDKYSSDYNESTDPFAACRRRMVEDQIMRRGVRDPRVLAALLKIPRHLFVPPDQIARSYDDCPMSIGFGQTISQPFIVAYMSEMLILSGTEKVLEIGTGSGYQTAMLAECARVVYTIEIIPELGQNAQKQLCEDMHYTNIFFRIGRGQEGWPESQPYDRIILTAAPELVPSLLFSQLAEGGILLAPEGGYFQKLNRYWQHQKKLEKEELIAVSFVPLVQG